MARNRTFALTLAVGVAAVVALGAWVAGSSIESPADAAARTAPPTPSPILVPIEERVLSANIVTRGTARFGLPQKVSIAPSALKPNPGLIATLPARNTQLAEGSVMFTASGRPVFVLQGNIPAYRDLVPGLVGDDVRQLEQALARLGFNPGAVDGVYDHATSVAVASWYRSRKWDPFGPTRDQLAALSVLERDWGDASRAHLAAAAAVGSAGLGVESARATAEQTVRAASAELAAKSADARRTALHNGTSLAIESEAAKAQHADSAASAEVAAQTAERALVVLDPRQPATARTSAEAKLDLARAAARKTKIEGELAILAAQREAQLGAEQLALAEGALKAARLEGEKGVRAAIDAQKLAELDARLTKDRADHLAAELGAARSKIGVQVPADEIAFIPTLPVRVEEVTAAVGAAAAGPVMSVTDNQLAIDSSLALDAAPLVKPGMAVEIDEQDLGVKAKGVVEQVASSPGTRGVDGYHIYFEVRLLEAPSKLEGYSLRLKIPIQSTKGAVIAVPTSALSLAADGTSRVQVQEAGGFKYVNVKPGLAADGYVEVTPLAGKLTLGQLVVVGYKVPEKAEKKVPS